MTSTVAPLLSGVSKVFVLTRLDRCGLCRGCGWVWFQALSKWSSVSGVRRTWGVFLHLSPLLQWPLVQPALWPLRPPPQSVPAQLHLPDTLQWNSLLQMSSWWVNTPAQPHTNSAFFSARFSSITTPFCSIGYCTETIVMYFEDYKKSKLNIYVIDQKQWRWGRLLSL